MNNFDQCQLGNPALPRLLKLLPPAHTAHTAHTATILLRTKFSLLKPTHSIWNLKTNLRTFPWVSNQNFRQIGPGVPEL